MSFTSNAGNYRVRGVELQGTARVTHELTLFAGGALNSSEATTSPALVGTDTAGHSGVSLPANFASPFGSVGDSLALSPLFKGNIRARYEWEVGDYLPFFQISMEHLLALPIRRPGSTTTSPRRRSPWATCRWA